MKCFVVLSAVVAVCVALPQGYNYPRPVHGSSLSGGSQLSQIGFTSQTGNSLSTQQFDGGDFGGSVISGGGGVIGGGDGLVGGGTQLVQKHIYVHVAPPEPEEHRQQTVLSQGQSTKHYKIIFIKAPTPPTPTAPQILAAQQNQEKTLIYVLSKHADDYPEVSIPTAAPTQPSKPEVYFIRYKAKKQQVASDATGGSLTGLNLGGSSLSGGSLTGTSESHGSSISGQRFDTYGPPKHF